MHTGSIYCLLKNKKLTYWYVKQTTYQYKFFLLKLISICEFAYSDMLLDDVSRLERLHFLELLVQLRSALIVIHLRLSLIHIYWFHFKTQNLSDLFLFWVFIYWIFLKHIGSLIFICPYIL